jgi:hypothetical protein
MGHDAINHWAGMHVGDARGGHTTDKDSRLTGRNYDAAMNGWIS